jgi:hypothetical protein
MDLYREAQREFRKAGKRLSDPSSSVVTAALADYLFLQAMDKGDEETVRSCIGWLERRLAQHRAGDLPKHLR